VRPIGGFGNFGRRVIESRFVQGFVVGGTVGVVRAGTSLARSIQTGYVRAYALLLVIGVLLMALYFLWMSS
jgi:NADH-quinone oxidoreductase subunit L